MIEQRIGRLDRLERDPARPVVHSVVIYSRETFEEALFQMGYDLDDLREDQNKIESYNSRNI